MYPEIADESHGSDELVRLMRSYFTIKTSQDVDGTMAHFSPGITYSDAVLGWVMDYDSLRQVYSQFMPQWGQGQNYPTRLVGDEQSAVVFMTCTPELFGQEALCVVAADIRNSRIVRWVDYWDARHFGVGEARQLEAARPRAEGEPFPDSFGEERLTTAASERIQHTTDTLTSAMARSDAAAAASLFSWDCVFEDMTLRSQIRGRLALERYMQRALGALPYGADANLRHVLGSDQGGGYEWTRRDGLRGVTCLELDQTGAITRMTSVWNGALMADDAFRDLALQTFEPGESMPNGADTPTAQ